MSSQIDEMPTQVVQAEADSRPVRRLGKPSPCQEITPLDHRRLVGLRELMRASRPLLSFFLDEKRDTFSDA